MNQAALDQLIDQFCFAIAHITEVDALQAKADDFLRRFPTGMRSSIAARLHRFNPFYLPHIVENASLEKVDEPFLNDALLALELSVRNNRAPKFLVACAPKSASTFVASVFANALKLDYASLIHNFPDVALGEVHQLFLREQELDSLALIRSGFKMRGYVAQHHTRCTPYLCNQLLSFGISPVVTYRNIFDSLISLDDMCMKDRRCSKAPEDQYFRDGLPRHYHRMEPDDRLVLLAGKMAHWYVNFYISWRRCEAMDLVKPLWISYETDLHGDRDALVLKIGNAFDLDAGQRDAMQCELEKDLKPGMQRLNIGVIGRGASIPEKARALIMDCANSYSDEGIDLSPILG